MPYIKELIDKRWIVYSDVGNYTGLLIKANSTPDYVFTINKTILVQNRR